MRLRTSDRYEIPGNYFGAVDDEFYGVARHIVALASLIELQLLQVLCTLDGKANTQERYAGTPTTPVIDECRKLVGSEPNLGETGRIRSIESRERSRPATASCTTHGRIRPRTTPTGSVRRGCAAMTARGSFAC